MFATRILSCSLLFLTFGLTFASPTPIVEKRTLNITRIQHTLGNLENAINPILSQITHLTANRTGINFQNLNPLVTQVIDAVNSATHDLRGFRNSGPRDLIVERQSAGGQAVAEQLSGIVSSITTAFGGGQGGYGSYGSPYSSHSSSGGASIHNLYSSLDGSLGGLLYVVEGLLGGVLKLVAGLVYDLANLLRNLGFGTTRSALQL